MTKGEKITQKYLNIELYDWNGNKIKLKKNDMILPKQKNINLRDPELKTKGIKISSKKKNIRNKYENKHKKDTSTTEETQSNT